jgi:RNA polymerase sigma factor (sigma-70 family)
MASGSMNRMVQHLRRVVLVHGYNASSDAELLSSFIERQDEAAFAALVRRHGPMVLGVCRRVLHNHHDAEDAFQAAFLVLARKAGSVRPRDMLSNWLYGVAYRTSLKANATNVKRRAKELPLADMSNLAGPELSPWREFRPMIDEELSRLPSKYRVAVILCDLEGKTQKETAVHLGWPQGTVSARLARGRAMLGRRLVKRGVGFAAGSLAAGFPQGAALGTVPPALLESTLRAASLFTSGKAVAAGEISANVLTLTKGVLKTMMLSKIKSVLALVMLVGVLGAGTGALCFGQLVAGGAEGIQEIQAQPKVDKEREDKEARRILRAAEADLERAKGRVEFSEANLAYAKEELKKAQAAYEAAKQKAPKDIKEDEADYSASEVGYAFNTNEALADETLARKRFSVRGKIAKVERCSEVIQGKQQIEVVHYRVKMNGPSEAGSAILRFEFDEKDRKELAKLRPNKAVTIEGLCCGREQSEIVFKFSKIKFDRDPF